MMTSALAKVVWWSRFLPLLSSIWISRFLPCKGKVMCSLALLNRRYFFREENLAGKTSFLITPHKPGDSVHGAKRMSSKKFDKFSGPISQKRWKRRSHRERIVGSRSAPILLPRENDSRCLRMITPGPVPAVISTERSDVAIPCPASGVRCLRV